MYNELKCYSTLVRGLKVHLAFERPSDSPVAVDLYDVRVGRRLQRNDRKRLPTVFSQAAKELDRI